MASKADEPRFGACDKNMDRCDSVTAKGAGGIVPCTQSEMIRVVGMKAMSHDKLEAHRLKIAGALNKTPLGEVQESMRSGLGKNWVMQV